MNNLLKRVVGFVKKTFFILLVYIAIISIFSYFINKDGPKTNINLISKNREEIYKVINNPKLNKTKRGQATIKVYRGAICFVIGEGCTDRPEDGDKNFNKSAFGFIAKLIATPYANPPASGVYWVYSGLQNAGFVPKTLAAEGIGFSSIKPFMDIWKIFRDLSYMLLVLILITIGFMIMFRTKISQQTIISAENSLPRIIIALILITFSFAIAGFIIDLMYVSIGIIVSVLKMQDSTHSVASFKNSYMVAQQSDLFRDITLRKPMGWIALPNEIGNALFQMLPNTVANSIRALTGLVSTILLSSFVNNVLLQPGSDLLADWTAFGVGLGKFPSGLVKIILSTFFYGEFFSLIYAYALPSLMVILIFFSIGFLYTRISVLLLFAYIKSLLLIILAPLILIFEAVPGKSALKYWIMNLIGNLIIFPLTIFIFALSYTIMKNIGDNQMVARFPYMYGIGANGLKVIIATGLIFLIPDLYKLTKQLLGIKDLPIPIGVGTFFGGVGSAVGGGAATLGQISSIGLGISQIGAFSRFIKESPVAKSISSFMGKKKKPPLSS